ncbi:MAG: isoprenylcysteine carboxylmethyltransferase family protein [Myxococcota bacterium]
MTLRRAIFFFRNPLAGLPLLIAFIVTIATTEGPAQTADPTSLRPTLIGGFVLAAAGVALRAWSACHNSYGRSRPKSLATTGPYAINRNPLYVGSAAIIAGGVLASDIPFALAACAASFAWSILIFDVVVQLEEVRLEIRYGADYLRYKRSIPRWKPQRPTDLAIGDESNRFLLEIFSELPGFLVFAPWVALRLAQAG